MIAAAAMQAILRNKMRSALTMLGVFIGVAALIAMVAVGQGANEAVLKTDRESRYQSAGHCSRRHHDGRHARRIGKRLHAHGRRRRSAAPRGTRRRQRQLPHPTDGTSSICQSELDDEHSGRQSKLSADHQLANRQRTRDFAR